MLITDITEEFPEARNVNWRRDLEREFRFGTQMEKARYMARQMEARKDAVPAGGLKTMEGLGQLTAIYDARTFFRWQEEDEYFWDDDNNARKFLMDNPECKAPRPVQKPMIIVP